MLSDEEIMFIVCKADYEAPARQWKPFFARAIEAEVRKQDEALLRQALGIMVTCKYSVSENCTPLTTDAYNSTIEALKERLK